jgi:hypothetical protein
MLLRRQIFFLRVLATHKPGNIELTEHPLRGDSLGVCFLVVPRLLRREIEVLAVIYFEVPSPQIRCFASFSQSHKVYVNLVVQAGPW